MKETQCSELLSQKGPARGVQGFSKGPAQGSLIWHSLFAIYNCFIQWLWATGGCLWPSSLLFLKWLYWFHTGEFTNGIWLVKRKRQKKLKAFEYPSFEIVFRKMELSDLHFSVTNSKNTFCCIYVFYLFFFLFYLLHQRISILLMKVLVWSKIEKKIFIFFCCKICSSFT